MSPKPKSTPVSIIGPIVTQTTELVKNEFMLAVQKFLGVAATDTILLTKHWASIYLYVAAYAMRQLIQDLERHPLVLQRDKYDDYVVSREINLDNQMPGEGNSTYFVTFEGIKLVVMCEFAHRYDGKSKVQCYVKVSEVEQAKKFFERHSDYITKIPRTLVFDGVGVPLINPERLTWDDIVIDPETKKIIVQQTKMFQTTGKRSKRGILIHGEPGNGKTLLGKILAHTLDCHCFYITSQTFDTGAAKQLSMLFELARLLKPSILFFEDIDLIVGKKREENAYKGFLGELLNQLDGPQRNEQMLVMATTNDITALDDALANRPGRFDVKIEFGNPNETNRSALLSRLITVKNLDPYVELTNGLSCAQVNEVGHYIAEHPGLTIDETRAYVKLVKEYGKKEFGFRSQAEQEKERANRREVDDL